VGSEKQQTQESQLFPKPKTNHGIEVKGIENQSSGVSY
jgi:hypothetical protein